MTKNILHIFLLSLVLLLGFVGCSPADEPVVPGPGEKQADVQVSFSLNLPTQFTSRAMSTEQEEQIDEIDVLAFVQDGSEYRFAYWRRGTGYTSTGKTFQVTLTTGPSNQRFMVLANAHAEMMGAGILAGDNVETVLGKIDFTSDDEWPIGSSNDYLIPMYDITTPTLLTASTTLSIELTRALAKINISLLTGVENFELKTAQVFNRVTQGYVGYKQAGTAWVPLDGSDKPFKTYQPSVEYAAAGTGQASNITDQIYILESPGTAKSDYMEATAIVVGGLYKPDAQTSLMRYYRIDLTLNGLISNTPTDILRTNRYDIQIQAVTNEGAQTAQQAFEGMATLKATVKTRTEQEENTSGIIIDGQYYLKISHPTLILGRGGNTITVTVETNYNADPNTGFDPGIRIGTNDLQDWTTVTSGENIGSGNIYRHEIEVDVQDVPENGGDRYTFFMISAGNMTHQMGISQGSWEWLGYYKPEGSYQPGAKGVIYFYSDTRQWKVTAVDDPSNVLASPQSLLGRTGVGMNIEFPFYIRTTATRGTSARLTFSDTKKVNPDVVMEIIVAQ